MAVTFQESDRYIGVQAIKLLNLFGPSGLKVLTDAAILNLTTVAGLRALITTAYTNGVFGPNELPEVREVLATIDRLANYGVLTGANITSADTFAGIISIVATATGLPDENYLDNTARQDGAYTLSGNDISDSIL